jgi:ribonuclease D
MPTLPPPKLITTAQQLEAALEHIRSHTVVAVDTESDSLYVYREKVCLIQISIPGADYLIDPLVGLNLQPLGKIFADPATQTVFHACEYDVICLRRDYGFSFANLFDTMWSARILGWPRVGLGDILKEKYDIQLDKRWQRHNWGKRPIETAALMYARLDTHYLLRLQQIQLQELQQTDRLAEAEEVFAELAQSTNDARVFDPDDFWHIKGAWDLRGHAAAILRRLYILRDHEAKRQNRPPFKIIGDRALIALAQMAPRQLEQLGAINGLSPLLIDRYGKAILAAIEHGRQDSVPTPPRRIASDQTVLARYEELRAWRKHAAAERGVELDVVAGNAVLMEIARRQPHTLNDLQDIKGLGPWRRNAYGQAMINVIGDA